MALVRTEVCRIRRSSPGSSRQQPAPVAGLGLAQLGEVDVDPPREQVLRVPGGLAVAEKDQVEHALIVCDRGGRPADDPGLVPARRRDRT